MAVARREGRTGRALCSVLALGVAAVWSGCAAVERPPATAGTSDAASVLALVQAREQAIVSLRTSFSARTRERDRARAADGVLLVQKPDRFRLRMMLSLGVTVFDYLTVGERTQIAFPLEGRIVNGAPQGDWAAFSRDDLSQAFLRGTRAFPGVCTAVAQDADLVVATCHERGRLQRRFLIERRTATVREEVSYTNERPRLVIRFGDYRMVGSTPMPFRVEMIYPERALVVEITVATTEVNPALEESLFQPLQPWGARGS